MSKTYKKNEFDKIEKYKKLKNNHKGKNYVKSIEERYNEKEYKNLAILNDKLDWY